ncbi:MAG TPA: hypothetical protein VFU21_04340 [Kofleriaceae bacterium]|nr:hypothetical protein [Kofleriaceae bacterium]
MTDDPLEWLAVALDDDEPTIPDAIGHGGWPHLFLHDDDTGPTNAIDDDEAPPEADWELEL